MAKPKDDTWVVKLDEHHPDHRVAATYADQQSRLAARRVLLDDIKRARNDEDFQARIESALTRHADLLTRLAEVDARIDEFNDEQKEEA